MIKTLILGYARKSAFLLFLLSLLTTVDSFAQNNPVAPVLPVPPVTLEYSLSGTPQAGTPIAITIKVTPQADMHLDINCLLPQGVQPVIEQGIRIAPYREKFTPNPERQQNYYLGANLWVGLVKAGETKTFTFHITASKSGSYNFICLTDALKQWGQKELDFTVDVN